MLTLIEMERLAFVSGNNSALALLRQFEEEMDDPAELQRDLVREERRADAEQQRADDLEDKVFEIKSAIKLIATYLDESDKSPSIADLKVMAGALTKHLSDIDKPGAGWTFEDALRACFTLEG